MKHIFATTFVVLCALFTFIDTTEYNPEKRSAEFYDIVSNPVTYFKDNSSYYRQIKQFGLPDDRKVSITNALSKLGVYSNVFNTKISSSQKSNGGRYVFFSNGLSLSKFKNNNFCATTNTSNFDDCDWLTYIESISLQGFLPIFLGIIAFPFACIIVWISRGCCCKANKPSKGLCCGDTKDWDVEKDGYTNSESTLIVMILVVASVIFLAFMSYAIVADDSMSGHISDFVFTLRNTSVKLQDSLGVIESTIGDLSKGSDALITDVDTEILSGVSGTYLNDFVNFIDDAKLVVDNINKYRKMFILISFIGPAVLCVVAVIVGATTFGIFFPLSTAFSDICVLANESFYTTTPREDFLLDKVLSCASDSPIVVINAYATTALNNATSAICDILTTACNTTFPCGHDSVTSEVINCPLIDSCPTEECTIETVDTWAQMAVNDYYIGCYDYTTNTFIHNTTGGTCPYDPASTSTDVCDGLGPHVAAGICNGNANETYSIDECAEDCASGVLREMAGEVAGYYQKYKVLAAIIEDEVLPLFNCVTVKELFSEMMDFMCYGTMSSLKPITISVCVMAVLALAATVVGIKSIKRFNKKYRIDEPNGGGLYDDDASDGESGIELDTDEGSGEKSKKHKKGGSDDSSESADIFGANDVSSKSSE